MLVKKYLKQLVEVDVEVDSTTKKKIEGEVEHINHEKTVSKCKKLRIMVQKVVKKSKLTFLRRNMMISGWNMDKFLRNM